MSRHLNFLIVALVAIILAGCGESSSSQSSSQESTSENRLSVVATTAQIGALVEEVAGDLVDLHILMGSGVDPHDFELTSVYLRALHDADLLLRNGIGLDDFLDPGIASVGGSATV